MAKVALSGGDLSLIRSEQWIDNCALHITPLVSIVTGTITAVPSRFPFVDLTISWNGSTSGVDIGQMVRITNGTDIRAYAIVRKAVSGSTLFISETPLGAYGYASNIEDPILVGDTVTVYSHRPLWGMYSRIAQNTFYKRWDVPYTNQNETRAAVANVGTWQAAQLGAGESTARFTLPRDGVNSSFVVGIEDAELPGFGITFTWTLPAGVSLVTGYALSDPVIEVDAIAGTHLVKGTFNDSPYPHTAYLWLFVSDGTTGTSLSERYAVAIDAENNPREGRSMSFTITGESLQDVLYPGAGILFREWPKFEGESLSTGASIDSFVGYIAELDLSHDGNIGTAVIKVENPMLYAKRIVMPSQSLTEKTEATRWTECESIFSNPRGFVYYLIKWHCPGLLDMHDLDAPYTSPRRKFLQCNTKNLADALNVVAEYIMGVIGSASDGTTALRKNPLYMSITDRNAIAEILTFQAQDVKPPFNYTRRFYNAFADIRGGFFAYSGGDKFKAWYVGKRWGQGSGSIEMPNGTVTIAEGVAKAKETIGHFAAEQNAEIQAIDIDLTRNQDVIDPAYMTWAALTVSSDFDPYGLGFTSNRLLPLQVDRTWELDNGDLKKRISLSAQLETFGQAGEEIPIGNAKGLSNAGWSTGLPIVFPPNGNGMFGNQAASLFLLNDDNGKLGITFNYFNANPEWTDLSGGVNDESVNDFDFDYGSAYFTNGRNVADALGLWVVTTDASNLKVWYYQDILRSGLATLIETATMSDATVTTEARIACSETYPDLIIAVWKDGTGTQFIRSTNGGSTWSSETRVGSAITDSETNDNAPIGLAVDGQRQLVTAPNATPVYGTYYASTAAGSFSKLSSSQDSPFPIQMLAIEPDATFAYVSAVDATAYSNDFDGADAWTYNAAAPTGAVREWDNFVESADWTYNGISAGGLSGNAPKWTGTNPHGQGIGIDRAGMDFFSSYPATVDFYGISFDTYFTLSAGTEQMRVGGIGLSNTHDVIKDTWTHVEFFGGTFPFTSQGLNINFAPVTDVTGTMTVWIDNVTVYIGTAGKLWKVTTFTGSPSWSNISPSANQFPARGYDLAVDKANTQKLHMTASDNRNWYSSTNRGSSWTVEEAATVIRALYSAGNAIALGGDEYVGISLDNGVHIANIPSNLEDAWGAIGTIKKVLAL